MSTIALSLLKRARDLEKAKVLKPAERAGVLIALSSLGLPLTSLLPKDTREPRQASLEEGAYSSPTARGKNQYLNLNIV